MGLRITDFSEDAPLADAIHHYQPLLQMTFGTNIFKVFETPNGRSQPPERRSARIGWTGF